MKEFNAKDFAAQVPCAASTIKEWRRTKKLLPARYDGRICIYNESQLPLARDILKGIIPDIIIPRHVYNTLFLHAEKISNGQEDFINVLEKELCNLNIAADGDVYDFVEQWYQEPDFTSRLKFFLAKRPLVVVDEEKGVRYRLVDYGETCDLELIDDHSPAPETEPTTEQPARMDDREGKKITPTGADENNISPNKFGINVITPPANSQVLSNLPDEILSAPRFFAVNADKTPKVKAWSQPNNQKLCTAIKADLAGFDTSGHEHGEDYLLIDFDNVIDDQGEFVNEKAEQWFNYLSEQFEGYCERSISGHGIHFLAKPTPEKFNRISNKKGEGIIPLDKPDKPHIKIELFYKQAARYCLLTGNLFRTTSRDIPSGAIVDEAFDQLIRAAKDAYPTKTTEPKKQAADQEKNFSPDIQSIIDRINSISLSELESKGYLRHSDHGAPSPYGYCCPWCGSGTHAHKTGALQFFTETTNNHVHCHAQQCHGNIITLLAKSYGIASTGKEFFELIKRAADDFNIPYDPKIFDFPTRRENSTLDSLNAQLKANSKDLADFDDHRTRAFETLRKLDTFDANTVFADNIISAAAFAFAYDKSLFATLKRDIKHYGDNHPPQKANINDFLAAVKFKADELQSQRADLINTDNKLKAQIHSAQFTSQNDLLKNFSVPPEYSISATHGVEKVTDKGFVTVCRRPVIVVEKAFNTDEKIIKFILAYQTKDGHWEKLPPVEAATIADNRRIITLANKGLPITSTTATALVDYLDAFKAQNEDVIPTSYTVPRCGWHTFNGDDYFIDPRRPCDISQGDKNFSVTVDERSTFAESLHTRGTLEHWKRAYELAKNSPVARFMTAAAVAPPLLKILGERNFLTYIYARTRAGKTTGLNLGASTTGSEKIIRSFDATKNGLTGAAADVNDYAFLVDEKQVADPRIKEQFTALTYALANGVGRTKLNKDSALRKLQNWRTIAIMTGETQLLDDTATEGADTRLLSIRAPKVILPPDTCREIRDIIKRNYGHALPRVIDTITQLGEDFLRDRFRQTTAVFDQNKDLLDDHRRYLAVITLADVLLNLAIGTETNFDVAFVNAVESIGEVVKLVPTTAELSPAQKYRDFVRDFVTVNQNKFIHRDSNVAQMPVIFGKIEQYEWIYIAASALKKACDAAKFDYRKLVDDLVDDGFFVPSDTIKKDRKIPTPTVQKKLEKANTECYRIRKSVFDGINDTNSEEE